MSYGLVTRALNAPIGVTAQNRFGLTRTYLPLSQYFLAKGGGPEKNKKGGTLYGLAEPTKPISGKKSRKAKTGKEGAKERGEGAFWAVPALPGELELLDEAKRRRGQMKVAKPQKCRWCDEAATTATIHSNAYAYVPTCPDHVKKAKGAVGGEFCYTQPIMQKGATCELCEKPASFLVYAGSYNAKRQPKGAIVKGCCQGHLKELRGKINNDPSTSKHREPIVKRLKTEGLDEAKKCRFCGKGASSSEGGIPCCGSHKKLGAKAARKRKSTSEAIGEFLDLKCNSIALGPDLGEESASRCGAVAASSGRTKPTEVQKRKRRHEKEKAEASRLTTRADLEAAGKVEVNPGVFIDGDDGIMDLIRLANAEDAGLTVFKSGAAGPSAGMTGSGNIPAVAVPIGAGNGGWDGIDWPGKKRKKRKRKDKELSKGIGQLLRRVW